MTGDVPFMLLPMLFISMPLSIIMYDITKQYV